MHGGDDAVPADRAPPNRALVRQVWANFNHMHVHVESSQDEIPTAILPVMAEQQATYHPRDALHNTGSAMLQTTAVGAVIAGVQNTLRKQNVGAMGILTRSGGVIALFGAQTPNWQSWKCCEANWVVAGAGGAYQFTLDATANLQQKDDCYNEFYAGFAAGAVTGIMSMCEWACGMDRANNAQSAVCPSCSVLVRYSEPAWQLSGTPLVCAAQHLVR
jgi:hypothetical protein